MSVKAAAESPTLDSDHFQTDRVITMSAGHAVHDTYSAFLPPLLPVFRETMGLSNTQAGFLSVLISAPSLLQPFIGYVADRVSLRYLVILTPAISATAMSLLGVAPTYAVLAILLLVVGLSSATLHSVGPVITGRLSGRSLGRGMGIWMVGGELGRTLGPIIIVTAISVLSIDWTPVLMVGGWIASVLLYVRLRGVSGRPPNPQGNLPWRRALAVMGPLLFPLIGIIAARSFMAVATTTYLPLFLTEEGADLWFAGAALSILEAAGVAGALLGGSLSDRVGRRTVLFASMLSTPVFMLLFVFAGGWVRFPLLLLLGFVSLTVTPVIMALVQESFPENRALANGTYMSLSFIIRSAAIVILGLIADHYGMQPAFILSALILFVGLPFVRLLPSREQQARN